MMQRRRNHLTATEYQETMGQRIKSWRELTGVNAAA
jgi:hypothetical protein